MAWTAPSTWSAGATLTAAQLNTQVRDNFKAIGDAQTAYTPTLTNWTLGNGTLTGKYIEVGKFIVGSVFYTVGSTDTKSGNLVISRPVTAVSGTAGEPCGGMAELFDTSGSAREFYVTARNSTTTFRFYSVSGTIATATAPWTWATGDTLQADFCYEAA